MKSLQGFACTDWWNAKYEYREDTKIEWKLTNMTPKEDTTVKSLLKTLKQEKKTIQ